MNVFRMRQIVLSGLFAASLIATQSEAAIVTGVSIQSVSGENAAGDGRFAVNSINGNGLDPAATDVLTAKHNGVPGSANAGYSTSDGMWLAQTATATANIVYNLGAVYTIDKLYVWNYVETAASISERDRGANSVAILADNTTNPTTAIQNFTFSVALDITGGTAAGPNDFIVSYDAPAVAYTFSTPVTAQYFKLNILSNHGDGFGVGLAEIRFGIFEAPVPEPSAVLLSVFGLIGLIRVRRRP